MAKIETLESVSDDFFGLYKRVDEGIFSVWCGLNRYGMDRYDEDESTKDEMLTTVSKLIDIIDALQRYDDKEYNAKDTISAIKELLIGG